MCDHHLHHVCHFPLVGLLEVVSVLSRFPPSMHHCQLIAKW
jgi:hypothetical protein